MTRRAVADMPHTVYLHRDSEGAVIYVGVTVNLRERSRSHRYSAPWRGRIASIEVESVQPNRGAALVHEYELIQRYQPACNSYGRTAHSLCDPGVRNATAPVGCLLPNRLHRQLLPSQ
jgi:excinuclease UvrABC nuclease subunit